MKHVGFLEITGERIKKGSSEFFGGKLIHFSGKSKKIQIFWGKISISWIFLPEKS